MKLIHEFADCVMVEMESMMPSSFPLLVLLRNSVFLRFGMAMSLMHVPIIAG